MFDCGDFTLPTSSSSALTKQARWMALAGKTTQTVSSWHSQNASLFRNCVLGVTATGCPVTFLPFIFTAWLSYLLTFIAVHIGYPMVPSLLRYLCCVYSIRDALLGKQGIPWCGFRLPVGQLARESWLEERHWASFGDANWVWKGNILKFLWGLTCQISDESESIISSRCSWKHTAQISTNTDPCVLFTLWSVLCNETAGSVWFKFWEITLKLI